MFKLTNILLTALLLSAVFIPQTNFAQEEEIIRLVFAEEVANSTIAENTTVVKGHVELRHGSTRLFCDSALIFQDLNVAHAYHNVQINKGDTINLFCDSLKYDGKTNISTLISNVRFRDNEYVMLTDSMKYNANESIGYYTNHANISSVNSDLSLTSVKGYYYSNSKTFFFKDSVHLIDPKYELFSDTLEFQTINSSAHFHGPTTIIFDSSTVECNRGIYFSTEDRVQLWNGAWLNEPGRSFYADSLLYDQQTDLGEGFCHVMLHDTTENIKFLSDYMLKKPKNAEIILKNHARVNQYTEKDTLFLKGDTIRYFQDTISELKLSIIENNVSIIKGNLFLRCDSAYFSEKDSILKMHKEPIIWTEKSQLFADSIFTSYYDETFHEMDLYDNAMIISEHKGDTIHYDQVKGKHMTAILDSNNIKKVHIKQNAQTLYYVTKKETDSTGVETESLTNMNKIDCNQIILRFDKGEINRVSFIDLPTSVLTPIDQIPQKNLFLKGFSWEIDRKPDRPFPE